MLMLWIAVVLIVVSVALFFIGFVLVANATGVAPQRRTQQDPTGVRRAASGVEWRNVFRRIPSSLSVSLDKNADRNERLAALGSLCVLAAVVAAFVGLLALLAAFI